MFFFGPVWSETAVCWYKMQECRIYGFQHSKLNGRHSENSDFSIATGTDTDISYFNCLVSVLTHLLLVSVMVVVVLVAV
jgi:hypothetical protein